MAEPDAAVAAAMDRALALAALCVRDGDVPVGAVVLGPDGQVLGEGRNRREATGDATAHAEVDALRDAARVARPGLAPARARPSW